RCLARPFVKKISLFFNMYALIAGDWLKSALRAIMPARFFISIHASQGSLMWFRNLLLYRFSQPVPFTEAELLTALEQRPARPCASQETHTLGWTTPFGRHSENLLQVAE